jgi:tRNA A-37 threonylcarbamoyl transferase component Bud32
MESESHMSPTSSTAMNLRLRGISLPVARGVFVILSLAALIFFALGIPLYYNNFIKDLDADTLATLVSLGMSVGFYAGYQTALVILLAVGCTVAGVIIFRFKSDEWVALLVAFTVIGLGANAFEPLMLASRVIGARMPVIFVMAVILASHPLACYFMPDGKLPQTWLKYVGGIWFLWLMVSVFWTSFPVNLFNWRGDGFTVYLFSLLTVLLTGVYALIYRYTHTDNVIKREQLKWVIFSIAVAVCVGVGSNIFLTFFEKAHPSPGVSLIVNMVVDTISIIAQFGVPVAMVFSILRYRLYDIDLVINRSLIYGLLTTVLTLIFGAILFGLQFIFRAVTGNENPPTVGIVAATVAVFSLFSPTLKVSRRFVNKQIFGIDFDFSEARRRTAKIDKVAHLPSHTVASVGGYTDLELIARGGMGEIYKARHPSLNRIVAIKVLSAYLKDDGDFNKRFAREAEMMAKLHHPNIIIIYDYGEQDGLPYIVMEYLTGDTLSNVLKTRTRLSLEESLPLLRDLASALDYAHSQGIIHRDIKASNVIIEPVTTITDRRTQRAVLMDFGIARLTSEHTKITMTGDMLGTAEYISPEQIQGESELDGRADQYSLGVLAYMMITGKKPYERNNTWAMIRSHLEEPVPDPRDIVPSLPESAAQAIMKALAKKPEDRFASVSEFIEVLGK